MDAHNGFDGADVGAVEGAKGPAHDGAEANPAERVPAVIGRVQVGHDGVCERLRASPGQHGHRRLHRARRAGAYGHGGQPDSGQCSDDEELPDLAALGEEDGIQGPQKDAKLWAGAVVRGGARGAVAQRLRTDSSAVRERRSAM